MKLSDIIFYSYREWGLSPFQIIVLPSEKTKNFLFNLINDKHFSDELTRLRIKYKIPSKGYSASLLKNYKEKNHTYQGTPQEMKEYMCVNGTYDIEPLWNKMKKDIKNIVKYYNLDQFSIWNLFLLITHNSFIENTNNDDLPIDFYSNNVLKRVVNKLENPLGGILIRRNVTKQELKHWIDLNWDIVPDEYTHPGIKQELESIMPIRIVSRSSKKFLDLEEEMVELINKGKSVQQIVDILGEKYPDNEKLNDYSWVNTRVSRLKKALHISKT